MKAHRLFASINWFTKVNYSTHFVTTPIFYVNAAPHLGHLYSALIADAAYRYRLLSQPGDQTIFSTGTDEHGLKVHQAAGASINDKETVQQYCDRISAQYKHLFDLCGIRYTHFVRTTSDDHKKAVAHFWNTLKSKNYIYQVQQFIRTQYISPNEKFTENVIRNITVAHITLFGFGKLLIIVVDAGNYSGWYCVPDEMFVSDNQLSTKTNEKGEEIKISDISGHPVEWTEEENFMFRLSSMKSDLQYWLKDENRIKPAKFYNILNRWLEDEFHSNDISISRPRDRIHWGIPVPDCDSQIIYVWLDALVNYLTVAEYPDLKVWPPTVHVLGKDILKFHAIYWPAFLIAAGLEPPRQLLVHSHWLVNDEKMSKSKGNVINPIEKIDQYTVSGFRYFLLKEGVPHSDGNYSETKVTRMLNAELANTMGNLLNRCVSKTLNTDQTYPQFCRTTFENLRSSCDSLNPLMEHATMLKEVVSKHYDEYNFYNGIEAIQGTLRQCNKFFEDCKPWEKKTDPQTLKVILHVTMEILRICGIALLPIVPVISDRIFDKLAVPRTKRTWESLVPSWSGEETKEIVYLDDKPVKLFERIKI